MSLLSRPLSHTRDQLSSPLTLARTFATSSSLQTLSSGSYLANKHADIPDYPHPPNQWYKQSNFGLYGGACIRSGNTVSKKTETKNRRKWHPNVRDKRLYSEALGEMIRIRLVTRVLRTIDKCGGLDNYLLGDKSGRIKELGMGGWALRWRILQTLETKARYTVQRDELGLEGPTPFQLESERLEEEIRIKKEEDAEREAKLVAREEKKNLKTEETYELLTDDIPLETEGSESNGFMAENGDTSKKEGDQSGLLSKVSKVFRRGS